MLTSSVSIELLSASMKFSLESFNVTMFGTKPRRYTHGSKIDRKERRVLVCVLNRTDWKFNRRIAKKWFHVSLYRKFPEIGTEFGCYGNNNDVFLNNFFSCDFASIYSVIGNTIYSWLGVKVEPIYCRFGHIVKLDHFWVIVNLKI